MMRGEQLGTFCLLKCTEMNKFYGPTSEGEKCSVVHSSYF